MSSLLEQASLVVTPNGTKASKLYSVKPTDGSGDMTVVRATTATRVNSSGLIVSSEVNVPRLDYTGSSCPSLLVEPQRTNLLLRSEEFDNVYWAKLSTTVTANTTISPDGTQDADTMTLTDTGSRVSTALTLGAGTYTLSFYVKKLSTTSGDTMRLLAVADGLSVSVDFTPTTQWVRYSYTFTAATSVTAAQIRAQSLVGSVAIWGAQLEAGANATSYIPTTTASVTRNADLISKTGISSLIGQTEGTLFVDYNRSLSVPSALGILEIGIINNEISINQSTVGQLRFFVRVGGTIVGGTQTFSVSTNNIKIALKYSSTSYSVFVNGNLALNNISISSLSTSYDGIVLGNRFSSSNYLNSGINSVSLWKTRLTDDECITLTTL